MKLRARWRRLRYFLGVEFQRVYCLSCERRGRYLFHWHNGHQVRVP